MTYYDGFQQARCPACGVLLNSMTPEHALGCPYPMEQSLLRRPITSEELMAKWGNGANSASLPSGLPPWGEIQRRLEALLPSDFFTGQTTNATPTEPKALTLADLERAVHDIDPDGRYLQEARLMAACRKMDKAKVEAVIHFAEQVGSMLDYEVPR